MTFKANEVEALEKLRISQLIQAWGLWRDGGNWEQLRTTYTADAIMAVTWSGGPASVFIDRLAEMYREEEQRLVAYHLVGASAIKINRERAIAETRITIVMRAKIGAVAADVTAVGRFLDHLTRSPDDRWLIARRQVLFDRDSMQSANPSEQLMIDPVELTKYPPHYRCVCYALIHLGMPVDLTLPEPGSTAMAVLFEASEKWLHAA